VPDDRFGDLDPTERRGGRGGRERAGGAEGRERSEPAPEADADRRSAAERLAELDERHAAEEAESQAPPPARTGSRYAWVVGVAAFILIVVAAVNTIPNSGRGREGPTAGEVMPDFAAPSAVGGSDADANIRQRDGGSAEEGEVPACEVRGEDVVNICQLRRRPVVLTFVAPGCEEALDVVESVQTGYGEVSFVGVIIGESQEDAENILADHDWSFPVAVDPDSAVFNLYRAADCPTTVTAESGGEVAATRNGAMTDDELRAAVEEVAPPGGADAG
jgi:hypothetical protein